jgi:hypothetical protein
MSGSLDRGGRTASAGACSLTAHWRLDPAKTLVYNAAGNRAVYFRCSGMTFLQLHWKLVDSVPESYSDLCMSTGYPRM